MAPRERSATCQGFRVVVVLGVVFLYMPLFTEACWGETAPKYGDMTHDYELLEGDTLVLNCSLYSNYVQVDPPNGNHYYVNSSNLFFRRGTRVASEYIKVLDGLTAQLRIVAANATNSGFYLCEMTVPELSVERVVCSSKVNIGAPPKPVQNFTCISMYRENLTCIWDIENSGVPTKYTLSKNFYFSSFFENMQLQSCPSKHSNNTFCQWGENTDPPFRPKEEDFIFVLQGSNSLGNITQNFTMSHSEILLPNHPESLSVSVEKSSMSLHWSPPEKMKAYMSKPPLRYEIWIQELLVENPETTVIDAGNDVLSYTVYDLKPHILYNISVRCRSAFAPEYMWGPLISVQKQTLPDVPYKVPTFSKEAFELHHFDGYRTVTLYWQPVPKKHYNGNNFAYHVVCSYNNLTSTNTISTVESINVTSLSVSFGSLQEDCSYRFHIYSMNDQGLSSDFKLFVLDAQHNIPELPEAITAVSHDAGHYELSWKPPKSKLEIVDYMVFWCPGLKPWLNRCDDQIQWLNTSLSTNKAVLNLSDNLTNYQFAVVARTEKASSGLQWATCVVPFKGALGKIRNVIVEPKNATSLKIMWRLDCAAQKFVVKKFEIVYCVVDEQKQCQGPKESVEIADSESESYLLQELTPFSNYSVIIRAYNHAGRPSEDSDPKIQDTLQGAPSDPPQNVEAFATPDASFHLSWHPPDHPNGIVTHYLVCYNGEVKKIPANSSTETYEMDVHGLSHYVNYSIGVQACVADFCSHSSELIIVETDIGIPGEMDPPRIESVNSTLLKVSWNQPLQANGPLDFYEIQWKELKVDNSSEVVTIEHDNFTTGLSSVVEIICSGFMDGGIQYLFSVRAANIKDDGQIVYGSWSEPTQARACLLSQGVAMIIGAAIGGTVALAFVMVLIYKLISWMSDKIHQMKSITVCLPGGLDGVENNPLKNYENSDKSLLDPPFTKAIVGRLTHSINDVDIKNRHGSGSSQYSYSSTDELLYRYGKCTKYARKPSGESSGCSSMSSNITKAHLSSESSTESDFTTPPSPDLVFSDHGSHKVALPIVHEDRDPLSPDEISKKPLTSEVSKGIIVGKTVLENEPPYSKFGISRCETSLPPWWTNSLAFYSINLSNSEPSVKDVSDPVPMCMPYSKIGITKSSENVLGLRPADFNVGYSRIGIMPTANDNAFHSLTIPLNRYDDMGKEKTYMNGIVIVPSNKSICDPSANQHLHKGTEDRNNHLNDSSLVCFNSSPAVSKINEDSGYIKFRRSPLHVKSGYVPLNNVCNFEKSPYPLLTLPVDEVSGSTTDLSSGDLLSDNCKNGTDSGGNEPTLQQFMEYNPDAVAVIFNENLGLNSGVPFGQESESREPNSINGNSFHEIFANSGFKDDFGMLTDELVDASSDDLDDVHVDFCSPDENIIQSFDSQPVQANESRGLEQLHPFSRDFMRNASSCPTSVELEPDASPPPAPAPVDKRPVRNGYVSFTALSSMIPSANCVPKVSVPSENRADPCLLVNSSEKAPISSISEQPSDSYVFNFPPVKRKIGDSSSKYRVYPLLNGIPEYSRNCKRDSYERPRCTAVNGEKGIFEFMPTHGSEFCEV